MIVFFFWLLLVAPFFLGGLLLVALRAGVHIGDTDGREKLGDKPAWAAGCIGWGGGLGLWMMLSLSKSPARSGQNALCQKAALGWMYLVRGRRLG